VISLFIILHPDLFLVLDTISQSKKKLSMFYGRIDDSVNAECQVFLKVGHMGEISGEICQAIYQRACTIQAGNFNVFYFFFVYKFASKILTASLA